MERMVTISVRLSREMAETLRRQARFEGTTVDALVRSYLDRNVRRSKVCDVGDANCCAVAGAERDAAVDSSPNGPHIYGATGSQPL